MAEVDLSKLKVGDKILVEFKVKELDLEIGIVRTVYNRPYSVRAQPNGELLISPEIIAAHIPKPREFKIGDKVTWESSARAYIIRGIHDGIAWLPECVQTSLPLERLQHAD